MQTERSDHSGLWLVLRKRVDCRLRLSARLRLLTCEQIRCCCWIHAREAETGVATGGQTVPQTAECPGAPKFQNTAEESNKCRKRHGPRRTSAGAECGSVHVAAGARPNPQTLQPAF